MATIREAAAAGVLTGSRQLVTLITPGFGSSGHYSPEVLEQAAKDVAFPKGTQMHMDHDGEMARYEQPAGSVTRLAAVLTEDARWEPGWVDSTTGAKGRLVAEANVFTQWRTFLAEAAEYIGTSISAAATFTKGEVEGRKVDVVEKIHPSPLNRVDYVTVAGRGGRISAVLESANHIVSETVANDVEQWLSQAVRAAHNTDNSWVYLDGHDDAFAYFRNDGRLYRQEYTLDGVNVSLNGTPVEVRRRTEYDPVTPAAEAAPDSPSNSAGVTTMKEAATMATTTIEEAELATLKESSGRVPALETAAETATSRATVAEGALTESNDTAAAAIVTAALAEAGINAPKTAARLSKGYPVKENGAIDVEALATDVAESVAELQVANGAGSVRGVGGTAATEKVVTAESARAEILAASGYTPKGAK